MANQAALDLAEYTENIASRIDGFLYRGLNSADYAMVWVSAGFEALTGLGAPDFVAKRKAFSDLIHPDDIDMVNTAVADALAVDGRWQVSYRLKTPDGGWRYVHETGGGCERDPVTGEHQFLDGIILDAGRLTNLATKLDAGRASVKAMNGSIDQIFHTLKTLRLLSLNARIEAARAQQHGAGFSVVAQEMMSLAATGETVTRQIEAELSRLNDAIRI